MFIFDDMVNFDDKVEVERGKAISYDDAYGLPGKIHLAVSLIISSSHNLVWSTLCFYGYRRSIYFNLYLLMDWIRVQRWKSFGLYHGFLRTTIKCKTICSTKTT